jgi:hypothetical protein
MYLLALYFLLSRLLAGPKVCAIASPNRAKQISHALPIRSHTLSKQLCRRLLQAIAAAQWGTSPCFRHSHSLNANFQGVTSDELENCVDVGRSCGARFRQFASASGDASTIKRRSG